MYRHHSGFARRRPAAEVHASDHLTHRIGKIAALGTIVLLAGWAGLATLYILFRDDALKALMGRQIEITRSYEAQATQLEAEIDRLRSLKLIEQERVDRTLADIARRQSTLEARQSSLSTISAPKPSDGASDVTGSTPPRRTVPAAAPPKPSPLSDTILLVPPAERAARLESRAVPPLRQHGDIPKIDSATDVRLGNLARELDQIEAVQSATLNEIEERYDGRERRMRRIFAELGVSGPRPARDSAGTGGPFLPWIRPVDDSFSRQVHRIRLSARAVEALQREIARVPVSRPTSGPTDVTSPYGVRMDPFLRQLAMHTGVDFRGEPGDPVRAAAAGKVVQAERNGGYGLMVEIDHGNGIVTRYAHLSAVAVSEGATVDVGSTIGRIGSTGRSTGPHLHYEVRLNGEAVDPQRYLRAGLRLDAPH
jgi:murein DD-endopeptidase MepM/ murein hydrolase activator NlpD